MCSIVFYRESPNSATMLPWKPVIPECLVIITYIKPIFTIRFKEGLTCSSSDRFEVFCWGCLLSHHCYRCVVSTLNECFLPLIRVWAHAIVTDQASPFRVLEDRFSHSCQKLLCQFLPFQKHGRGKMLFVSTIPARAKQVCSLGPSPTALFFLMLSLTHGTSFLVLLVNQAANTFLQIDILFYYEVAFGYWSSLLKCLIAKMPGSS